MSEVYNFGRQVHEFLRGFLDDEPARPSEGESAQVGVEWGPRVDVAGLRDIYAPHQVEPFTVPPGGIDNLGLHSTDAFTIPSQGEFTVDFAGYFRVARDNPTSEDWATAEVQVNIIDLRLYGEHEQLGEITVRLNPDIVSSGQIFPSSGPEDPKACRIATAAVFEIPRFGYSVFNKEPILLMNEHVTSIPPVDDPNGLARIFKVPLFDRENPSGRPLAYLTSLRYGADNYLTESDARSLQQSRPRASS